MRLNQLCCPLPSTVNLVWRRVTFSRLTNAYFVFTVIHFIIQLAFQIKAFTVNANAADFLNNIVIQGRATSDSLPLLRGDILYLCSWVPSNLDSASCPVVWSPTEGVNLMGQNSGSNVSYDLGATPSVAAAWPNPTTDATRKPISSPTTLIPPSTVLPTVAASRTSKVVQTVTVFVLPTTRSLASDTSRYDDGRAVMLDKRNIPTNLASQNDDQTKVNIVGSHNTPVTLDQRCLWSLNWPVSELRNTKREDIVFIAFQFWLLGMSFVALLNESIPHILASLLMHVLATSWGAFQIANTSAFHSIFNRVITKGTCNGASLLPRYWQDRGSAEITSLAFNIFALLISCLLTWKLVKLFGWQTFKRVGASLTINRLYKIVLVLSILIQLCFFFIAVTVCLWIDQLVNSAIGDLASFQKLYKITSIITLILLIPWLLTGWFAVRRELRVPMFCFLLLSSLYLVGWGVMFFATTFKWTFVTWKFFSVMASVSVTLTVASFVLGVICRCNFGKGLSRYLSGQQNIYGDDSVYSEHGASDIEKIDFPSGEKPVLTYSASYKYALAVPAPAQIFTATRGPRFFNNLAEWFETPSTQNVAKSGNRLSDRSFGSLSGFYTYNELSHSRDDSHAKQRWVIE